MKVSVDSWILEILIIASATEVLFDILGVLVVGLNLFRTEADKVKVGTWIVPLHALMLVEEVVVLVLGLVDGDAFEGIWAIVQLDGKGGVTCVLLGLLILTDVFWATMCWRWAWECVLTLARFPMLLAKCGKAITSSVSRIG
ncbi:hypothetical protein EG329_010189 [Mollisiaceae sp. DMI_Dod_QoI]|nr:hypothetical protein EG329_010189 [Helotiales sp. DMI_Dod_QoI]